jgi:hypothetical protein
MMDKIKIKERVWDKKNNKITYRINEHLGLRELYFSYNDYDDGFIFETNDYSFVTREMCLFAESVIRGLNGDKKIMKRCRK